MSEFLVPVCPSPFARDDSDDDQLSEGGEDSFSNYQEYSQSTFQRLIMDFVIDSMVPLRSVNAPSFRKMFDILDIKSKGLHVISCRTLGRLIDESFSQHKRSIKIMLKSISWVCTSANIWSAGNKSFMVVTIHWLDSKNERKSVALACRRIKGTYESIAALMNDIHQEFGLTTDQIVASVIDNGSNFVKAFRVFGVSDESIEATEEDIETEVNIDIPGAGNSEGGSWVQIPPDGNDTGEADVSPKHPRCAANTLALVPSSDIMKVMDRHLQLKALHKTALEKCNWLWKMANRPKTSEIIEKVLKQPLSRPNYTRWNSLYDSLKQIVEIRPLMDVLVFELDLPPKKILSHHEYSYLEEYVQCTKPLADALDILQRGKKAYYGILVPTILALLRKLRSADISGLKTCGPIARAYSECVVNRFSNILNFNSSQGRNAALAAFAHPMFKKRWLPCVDRQNQEQLLTHFKSKVRSYFMEELRQPADSHDVDDPLEDFFDFGEDKDHDDLETNAQFILDAYFGDTSLESLSNYPSINQIFKQTNTQLLSSDRIERQFLYATMTNMPKSDWQRDEKFEERVILKANALSSDCLQASVNESS